MGGGAFYDRAIHERRVADYNAALRKYLDHARAAAEVGCCYGAVYKSATRYGLKMLRGIDVRREIKHAAIKAVADRDSGLNLSKAAIARNTGAALETVSAVLGYRGRRDAFAGGA